MLAFSDNMPRCVLLAVAAFVIVSTSTCGDHAKEADVPLSGPGNFDTIVGNGSFGRWTNDEFGLPAYLYTGCERASCSEPEDVFHQLGNDAVAAIAHGAGYTELFTAKTFYRIANHYDEEAGNFGGGFGWIWEDGAAWSTLWADRPIGAVYERVFGMGYLKKTVEHDGLRVESYVYAAPGSDEVLLEHLVFTNVSERERSLRYFDHWDVAWWLIASIDAVNAASGYDPATVRTSYDAGRGAIKAVSQAEAGDRDVPSQWSDPSPKVSFVAFLNDTPDGFDTVQRSFLGDGTRARPARIRDGSLGGSLDDSGVLPNQDAVLVTQKNLTLAVGESRALDVVYGLAERGRENDLIDAYRDGDTYRLPAVAADQAARMPRIHLPQDRWIAREIAWSHYYLSSGMLYEEFFDTRILNQGSIYQYVWGANAGPRASLRHLLPLIYTDPARAREMLVYHFRAMKPSGELSYATAGYGAWQPFGFEPSDHSLWLLWSAAEYVFATRDFAFLDETFDYYCAERRGDCGSATAYEFVKTAYRYQREVVGKGEHGLVRLMDSDWDDFLTSASAGTDAARTDELGESTMNTALALVSYPKLADLAELRGDSSFATSVREEVGTLTTVLREQWRGDFFNRAYVYTADDVAVEVGAENLFLASNGIALLVDDLLGDDEAARLIERMRTDLLEPSTIGLAAVGAPFVPGVGTPGFWYSLAGPAVEGLMRHRSPAARELAWAAFRENTFANHAEAAPDIWYGIWSGPDMYYTEVDTAGPTSAPGSTWCFPDVLCMRDFPVTNMFSHSEPLLSSIRLAGISVDVGGMTIDPGVPFEEFSWESATHAVRYGATRASGKVVIASGESMSMRVRLPLGLSEGNVVVRVNGDVVEFKAESGFVRFQIRSGEWSIE